MSPTADGRMVHAYAMQGDTAKAKAAYQDFLTPIHPQRRPTPGFSRYR